MCWATCVCVGACVEVSELFCACFLWHLGIKIREADYVREEEENRWKEKEEEDNYVQIVLEPRPVRHCPRSHHHHLFKGYVRPRLAHIPRKSTNHWLLPLFWLCPNVNMNFWSSYRDMAEDLWEQRHDEAAWWEISSSCFIHRWWPDVRALLSENGSAVKQPQGLAAVFIPSLRPESPPAYYANSSIILSTQGYLMWCLECQSKVLVRSLWQLVVNQWCCRESNSLWSTRSTAQPPGRWPKKA